MGGRNRTEQDRAEQSRKEQERAGKSRTEQDRTGKVVGAWHSRDAPSLSHCPSCLAG
ncbi:hypothetical protein LX36DRAFT_660246 [Colletotrichum falcatum]|nr:hypothetical protein LX36DRAFT_660246 [Colletotrichum falcatum]